MINKLISMTGMTITVIHVHVHVYTHFRKCYIVLVSATCHSYCTLTVRVHEMHNTSITDVHVQHVSYTCTCIIIYLGMGCSLTVTHTVSSCQAMGINGNR